MKIKGRKAVLRALEKIMRVCNHPRGQIAAMAAYPCRRAAPSASLSPSNWSYREKQQEKAASNGTDGPNATSC